MDQKFTSNKIDDDEFVSYTQKSDYINLITRLKEINSIIVLLKKQYLDKF